MGTKRDDANGMPLAKGGGPGRRGRARFLTTSGADLMLFEGEGFVRIEPKWEGDDLRLGCTTISKLALEKIMEFVRR